MDTLLSAATPKKSGPLHVQYSTLDGLWDGVMLRSGVRHNVKLNITAGAADVNVMSTAGYYSAAPDETWTWAHGGGGHASLQIDVPATSSSCAFGTSASYKNPVTASTLGLVGQGATTGGGCSLSLVSIGLDSVVTLQLGPTSAVLVKRHPAPGILDSRYVITVVTVLLLQIAMKYYGSGWRRKVVAGAGGGKKAAEHAGAGGPAAAPAAALTTAVQSGPPEKSD